VSTDHKVSDCVKVLTSHINAERAITRQGKKIYNMAYYNAKHKEILQQKKKYRGREEVRASDRNRKADEYEIERASVEMSEAAGFGVYGVFGFEFLNGIVEEVARAGLREYREFERVQARGVAATARLVGAD